MHTAQRHIGNRAESLVAEYLQKDSFTIISRNYSKQGGEIDLVAQKSDTVLFVEVKYRRIPPVDYETLLPAYKQHRIARTARIFVSEHTRIIKAETNYRYDLALVTEEIYGNPVITYFADAMRCHDSYSF